MTGSARYGAHGIKSWKRNGYSGRRVAAKIAVAAAQIAYRLPLIIWAW